MRETAVRFAELDAIQIGELTHASTLIVLLHGYAMQAADLAPFAHSLGLNDTAWLFAQGLLPLAGGARAWWPRDEEERAAALRHGSRDLAVETPPGRMPAREALRRFVEAARPRQPCRVLLAGFSQGGMLACDAVLCGGLAVDGLSMMSSSRIAIHEWEARRARLAGLPVLVSHGRTDQELSFAAGEQLRAFFADSGAAVQWVPFDGGHEIPFAVWRRFRAFAQASESRVSNAVSHNRED